LWSWSWSCSLCRARAHCVVVVVVFIVSWSWSLCRGRCVVVIVSWLSLLCRGHCVVVVIVVSWLRSLWRARARYVVLALVLVVFVLMLVLVGLSLPSSCHPRPLHVNLIVSSWHSHCIVVLSPPRHLGHVIVSTLSHCLVAPSSSSWSHRVRKWRERSVAGICQSRSRGRGRGSIGIGGDRGASSDEGGYDTQRAGWACERWRECMRDGDDLQDTVRAHRARRPRVRGSDGSMGKVLCSDKACAR
jgi:hypothetical protein